MVQSSTQRFIGSKGNVVVHVWPNEEARHVVVIAHGYAEHGGRYAHVAARLVERGAVVYAPDFIGHGRSEGERALLNDVEDVVADLRTTIDRARAAHPGLPVVLIAHSLGGLIATRYAQQHSGVLAGLVLSGALIGKVALIEALLPLADLPPVSFDPKRLSRDPATITAYVSDPYVYLGGFKRPTLEALNVALKALLDGPSLGDLPTLWLHGEADQLVPMGGTRVGVEHIRGTNYAERFYPGARHEVFNETNKDEVVADLVAFVDRVTREPAAAQV